MTEARHPEWERLLDFQEGRLTEVESAGIHEHVRGCETCASRLAEVAALREDLDRGDAGDAPETWVRRAELRAPLRGSVAASGPPRIAFDSLVDTLAGMRAGAEDGRQYVVEGEGVDVEVSVAPTGSDEPWPVSGQVLTEDPARLVDLQATFVEAGHDLETVRATAHGEFLFTRRPRGTFRVRLAGASLSFETPDLTP